MSGAGASAVAGAAPDRPFSGPASHHELAGDHADPVWNSTGSECETCNQK